jgi:hypothetical protein
LDPPLRHHGHPVHHRSAPAAGRLEALRAWRLAGRVRVPGREDFYVRRLLRDARDVGALVRLIPYSFHLPPEAEQA